MHIRHPRKGKYENKNLTNLLLNYKGVSVLTLNSFFFYLVKIKFLTVDTILPAGKMLNEVFQIKLRKSRRISCPNVILVITEPRVYSLRMFLFANMSCIVVLFLNLTWT